MKIREELEEAEHRDTENNKGEGSAEYSNLSF